MRSLKYAILGLLCRHPMTGYEIAKEFNNELAEFWYANHSQIYPELKRLNDEGLVSYDIEISGEILEAKRYTITEDGYEDFAKWLNKDEKMQKTPKDIFRLRMYFFRQYECGNKTPTFGESANPACETIKYIKKEK